jgi:hypothetical protein
VSGLLFICEQDRSLKKCSTFRCPTLEVEKQPCQGRTLTLFKAGLVSNKKGFCGLVTLSVTSLARSANDAPVRLPPSTHLVLAFRRIKSEKVDPAATNRGASSEAGSVSRTFIGAGKLTGAGKLMHSRSTKNDLQKIRWVEWQRAI